MKRSKRLLSLVMGMLLAFSLMAVTAEIGRASCRDRVSKSV